MMTTKLLGHREDLHTWAHLFALPEKTGIKTKFYFCTNERSTECD